MKIAIALAALIAATPALAQETTPTGNSPMTVDPSTAPVEANTPPPAAPMASPGGMDTTPSVESATPSPTSANTPAGSQPKDYPTCTRKIRDHCKNPGGK